MTGAHLLLSVMENEVGTKPVYFPRGSSVLHGVGGNGSEDAERERQKDWSPCPRNDLLSVLDGVRRL